MFLSRMNLPRRRETGTSGLGAGPLASSRLRRGALRWFVAAAGRWAAVLGRSPDDWTRVGEGGEGVRLSTSSGAA